MARLDSKIEAYLGRKVDFTPIDGEINLQDDGSGAYIAMWNAPEPQPTQTQLDSVDSEANRAEELETVRANRKAAYAPIAEQLDMQYHDSVTGSRTWLDHVESVKDAHPK